MHIQVTVYNNSLAPDVAKVFMMYTQDGFVDFRQAPDSMPDEGELTILLNMSPVLNDCMYRNMYRYKKVRQVKMHQNWCCCFQENCQKNLYRKRENELHN